MAKVSLKKASDDTGIPLSTLSRWRKGGKFSSEKNPHGDGYLVDTSEYDRIKFLKEASSKNVKKNEDPKPKSNLDEKVEIQISRKEISMLKEKIVAQENSISKLEDYNADLSRKLDKAQETLNNQTKLLAPPKKDADRAENFSAPQVAATSSKSMWLGSISIAALFILVGTGVYFVFNFVAANLEVVPKGTLDNLEAQTAVTTAVNEIEPASGTVSKPEVIVVEDDTQNKIEGVILRGTDEPEDFSLFPPVSEFEPHEMLSSEPNGSQ